MALSALLRRRKTSFSANVYYLGTYVRDKLASSEKLWYHAARALKKQEDEAAYDNQMMQGNMCPCCHSDLGEKR